MLYPGAAYQVGRAAGDLQKESTRALAEGECFVPIAPLETTRKIVEKKSLK